MTDNNWDIKICCMGAGHVGGPNMAVLAKMCPKIRVCVVDQNQKQIDAWKTATTRNDKLPIHEPGLLDVVKIGRDEQKNLIFSTDIETEIEKSDIVFISVNAKTKTKGIGAGRQTDIANCELCARKIAEVATSDKIVVEKSTVPVRTANAIKKVLKINGGGKVNFQVLSNPEFLSEGAAIRDLEHPDRVLIGGDQTTPEGRAAAETLANVYANWVDRNKILTTDLWSSELSKLVNNAFLAQRVSSINSISALCEATGADVTEIRRAVGMDERIGSRFLHASVGFGGSCFQKDILNLVYLCETFGLHECADYWKQVVTMNEYQKKRFSTKIVHSMFNTVAGKKIAILGFTFKANTSDVRETPSMFVTRDLLNEGAQIYVYDPQVKRDDMLQEMDFALNINHETTPHLDRSLVTASDPYEACVDSHAICILTEWSEFQTLDYQRIFQKMAKPAFVFDGRNTLDHKQLTEIGFEVHGIGRPDSSKF